MIREEKVDDLIYRFGYQGQFAERDEETGWNHFELREYDPVVGRWLSVDPYGQYWSPYIGMGNDPSNGVDPDGAYSRFGAWWRNIRDGGMGIYENEDGVWGYDTKWYDSYEMVGGINAHFGREDTGTVLRDLLNEFSNSEGYLRHSSGMDLAGEWNDWSGLVLDAGDDVMKEVGNNLNFFQKESNQFNFDLNYTKEFNKFNTATKSIK